MCPSTSTVSSVLIDYINSSVNIQMNISIINTINGANDGKTIYLKIEIKIDFINEIEIEI